ncbi:MAG: hypothetical protein GY943_28115 [Chloroflexi bacterium]|nr:hypothetical protein [Chloroflexota bacterium]
MKQFAQTTIVQPLLSLRRQRLLPQGGEVIVKVGQTVPPLHVLARTPLSTEFIVVSVGEQLGVSHEELSEFLLVNVGDSVSQGEPLAEKKRLLGAKQVKSPIEGEVAAINNGRLVLKQTTDWYELRAMVNGRVLNYVANRGVTLEIVGALIQGKWATGSHTLGDIEIVDGTHNTPLQAEQIPSILDNRVLVTSHIGDLELLTNLADNRVSGIIAGSMPIELCEAATSINLPVILTEGIGTQSFSPPIIELLQELSGESASLFTKYDLEQGQRPEIIVPRKGVPKEASPFNKPLTVGQTVRIIRTPYQSQIGVIEKIFSQSYRTADGIKAEGATVKLLNGNVVFVPTVNLDILI